MKHTTFQMVRMMTDGITGALKTGEQSGMFQNSTYRIWMMNILELTFSTAWSPPEGIN